MGGKSVTASERKGILAVAAVTLLVTGAGLIVSRCDTASDAATPAGIEVVYAPDPAATPGVGVVPTSADSVKTKSSGQKLDKKKQTSASGKSAGKSTSGKSAGKPADAPLRSPRDESVPQK